MLKEGQLLCRMDYEKEREMLAAISPTPTESGKEGLLQGCLVFVHISISGANDSVPTGILLSKAYSTTLSQ